MSVTVDKNGMDEFFGKLNAAVPKALSAASVVYVNALKSKIKGNRGEAVGRVTYIRSAPGEPPHSQTGALRNSMTFELDGARSLIGPSVEYGKWLEFGTSKMAARPFVRPVAADRRTAKRAQEVAAVSLRQSIAGAKAGVFELVSKVGRAQ